MIRALIRLLATFGLLALLAPAQVQAQPQPQSLKVITTGAFKQVVVALIPAFESRSGVKVELLNDTAGGVARRIEAGEAFDVVFLTPAGLTALAAQGRIDPASVRPIAKVGIGVAVKSGAPRPPLETVEQFKAAVLAARKVAYIDPASGGSSGIYLDGLFRRLGLADAVRPKAVLVQGGLVAERVANGDADLAIHQVSEIMPVPGVDLVGTLPEAIQNETTYGCGISTASRMGAVTQSFVAAFGTGEAAEAIRAKGMVAVGRVVAP